MKNPETECVLGNDDDKWILVEFDNISSSSFWQLGINHFALALSISSSDDQFN